MIRSIRIQNFKSVADVELSGLEQINVLYGLSGTGKTNILEAIGFLRAATIQVDTCSLTMGGVRDGKPKQHVMALAEHRATPIVLSTTLVEPNRGTEIQYGISLEPTEEGTSDWLILQEQLQIGDVTVVTRDGQSVEFLLEGKKRKERGLAAPDRGVAHFTREGYWILEHFRHFVLYKLDPVVLYTGAGRSPIYPLGSSGEGFSEFLKILFTEYPKHKQEIVKCMSNLYDWITDVQVCSSDILIGPMMLTAPRVVAVVDKRMKKGNNLVPALQAGESVVYSLGLLSLAVHPHMPIFFAIDSFGVHADPALVRKLTDVFCRLFLEYSSDKQVILATNNQEVLRGLPESRIKVFLVRRENGATIVTQG